MPHDTNKLVFFDWNAQGSPDKSDVLKIVGSLGYTINALLDEFEKLAVIDEINTNNIKLIFQKLKIAYFDYLHELPTEQDELVYLQSGNWVWAFMAGQTKLADQLVRLLWQKLFASSNDKISILAIGGYGRKELFPFSDLDLLILACDEQTIENHQSSIGKLIQQLWDSGLQPSHQVMTLQQLDDLAKHDLPLATSLLEARFIVGHYNAINDIHTINESENWSFERFFQDKLSEQAERHKSYLGTHYHLEPDIKNNLGGLRELHLLRWLAIKLALNDKPTAFNPSSQTNKFEIIFKPNERKALYECLTQLNAFRFALHLCLKRKDDRLLFQHQIAVAKLLGYREVLTVQNSPLKDIVEQGTDENVKVGVEAMMKVFYLTNQQIIELNQLAILLFAEFAQLSVPLKSPQITVDANQQLFIEQSYSHTDRLNTQRQKFHKVLHDSGDGAFELIFHEKNTFPKLKLIAEYDFDALRVITLFYLLAELDLPVEVIELQTFRRLREVRETVFNQFQNGEQPKFARDQIRQRFMELLMHENAMKGLLPMHRLGFLWRYDSNWLLIQGLMQFDRFHAYTVDEHTFQVMLQIEHIKMASLDVELRTGMIIDVWRTIEQDHQLPKLLLVAGLFHDLGKGRGGNHAEIGAQLAADFFAQHPIESHEADLVIWLVRHHLDFSITAQRRDISDVNVIEAFAKLVENVERLQLLFLLTVADIKGTHPTLWNSWKQTLLEQLYHKTYLFLTRKKHFNADWREQIRANKHNAKSLLLENGYLVAPSHQNRLVRFWQRCRVDYFLSHSPAQLSWHACELLELAENQLLDSGKTLIDASSYLISAPRVLLSNQFAHGGSELFIWAHDRKNLFAYVVELIDRANLSVLAANIFTNRDNMAMDSFIVTERFGKKLDEQRQLGLIATLQSALDITNFDEGYPLSPLPKRQEQKLESVFSIQTQIKFLPSQHPNRSYLEIIALDRKGLLAKIAHTIALQNLVILGAKITTVGERAEDMFILVDNERNALSEGAQKTLISALEIIL